MKQFTDGSNNFPLVEKSTSSAGSSPTAANFNGPTAELVAIVRSANFPLDPLSGALIGSDGKPLMESESNKQILRAIQFLDQQKYFQMLDKLNKIVKTNVGNGRVEGLETTKLDTLKISLSAGFGITPNGQQITTTEALGFDLTSQAISSGSKTIEVGLLYSVEQANYIIGDGNLKYKAEEIFTLAINSTDPNFLALAKVTIDNTGITSIQIKSLMSVYQDFEKYKDIHKVGETYIQLATENSKLFDNAKSPGSMYGNNGNWVLRYGSKSVAFRTEGIESNISRGADGIQWDALQNHLHDTALGSHGHNQRLEDPNGPIGTYARYQIYTKYWNQGPPIDVGIQSTNLGTKRSGNPLSAKTATETRMKNALIRIYELISYRNFY